MENIKGELKSYQKTCFAVSTVVKCGDKQKEKSSSLYHCFWDEVPSFLSFLLLSPFIILFKTTIIQQ